jgi:hypothetical protein
MSGRVFRNLYAQFEERFPADDSAPVMVLPGSQRRMPEVPLPVQCFPNFALALRETDWSSRPLRVRFYHGRFRVRFRASNLST